MYRSIGMDLGVKTTDEVVVMEPGDASPRVRFRSGHTREDLEHLLNRVQVGMEPGTELRFIMEPTATAWIPIATFLHQRGHRVYLVKAEMVKDQRKVLKKHVKTDQIDAITLATLPWVVPQALHQWIPAGPKHDSLRRWVKLVHKLSISSSDRKNRIQAQVQLVLPVGLEGLNLFTKVGQVLCTRYLNPDRVSSLGLRRLTQVVQRIAGRKEAAEAAATWYAACMATLELYAGSDVDFTDVQDECAMEFEALTLEQKQSETAKDRIEKLYRELHPSRNLETIYGVGPYIAAVNVAAIGVAQRFPSTREYRAYTGMIPRVSASGESEAKGIPISKAGPNWLKWALYLAAETARQWDPQLALIYYNQMVKCGHHHCQAVCAVAAHLADRIFVVYRDDKPYQLRDPEGHPLSPAEAKAYIQ